MRKTASTTKSRNISISLKVVLCFGVLMLLCLAILGCLLFSYLRAQLEKEQDRLIQASFSIIDETFSDILDEGKSLTLTQFNSKNGKNTRYKSSMQSTEKLSYASELWKELTGNTSFHSIYVLNKNNEVVLHVTNTSKYTEDLTNVLPEKNAKTDSILIPSFWMARSNYPSMPDVPLYSIIIREAPVASNSYSGAFVLNLDMTVLSDEIFAASKDSRYIDYLLVDQNGIVLADSKGQDFGQNISDTETFQRILVGQTGKHRERIDGVLYECSVIKSRQSGVYIIAWSNYQEQINNVYTILLIIIAIVLFASGVIFLISYRYSWRVFAPVRDIVAGIKDSDSAEYAGELRGDELQLLEQYYYRISTYVDVLKDKEYKDSIVKNLFTGNPVQSMLLKNEVVAANMPYCVLLLCMPDDGRFTSLEEYSEYINGIKENINDTLHEFGQCTWFEISFRRRMLILSPFNDFGDFNINIIESIEGILESTFEGGSVSNVLIFCHHAQDGQNELSDIYRDIDSIRRTRMLLNPNPAVIRCEDATQGFDQSIIEKLSAQLLQYLKESNQDNFSQTLNEILDEMENLLWNDYFKYIVNLAQSLMIVHDGVNVIENANENRTQQIIDKLDSIQNRMELVDWFIQLFEKNTYGSSNAENQSVYGIIEIAVDYLNSNYGDSELNTNLLAKKLNVSSSYFGKLFKKYTGLSMSEYLTKLRIEKAHSLLLLNVERDVSEIAAEVGYSNSGYFATVFKKYYGVSPSKIQELYTLEKIENDKQKGL